jgi:hypothetical protein
MQYAARHGICILSLPCATSATRDIRSTLVRLGLAPDSYKNLARMLAGIRPVLTKVGSHTLFKKRGRNRRRAA